MLYALQKHWLANKFIYSLRHDDENRSNTYSFMSYITFSIWGPMSLAGRREHRRPAAVHSRGGSGGMLPLVILGVLGYILVHFEAYREVHKASREETHHYNHHCLLSYWNTGNHLHRLSRHNSTNKYTMGTLPNNFIKISVIILSTAPSNEASFY